MTAGVGQSGRLMGKWLSRAGACVKGMPGLPHFKLDSRAVLRFNNGDMRTLATLTFSALAALVLSSCQCQGGAPWGAGSCSGYNPDLIRDLPVTRSQRFQ